MSGIFLRKLKKYFLMFLSVYSDVRLSEKAGIDNVFTKKSR